MAQSSNPVVQNALLATNENWVTMHGTHVLIDDDGMPSKKTPIGRMLRRTGAAKEHRWFKGASKSVFAAGVAGASSRASEGGREGKAGIKTLKDMRSVAKKMGGVAVKEWNKAARKHGLKPIKNNKEVTMVKSTNQVVANALAWKAANAVEGQLTMRDKIPFAGDMMTMRDLQKYAKMMLWHAEHNGPDKGMIRAIDSGSYDDTAELKSVYDYWKRLGTKPYDDRKREAQKILQYKWNRDVIGFAREVVSQLIRAAEEDKSTRLEELAYMREELQGRGVKV